MRRSLAALGALLLLAACSRRAAPPPAPLPPDSGASGSGAIKATIARLPHAGLGPYSFADASHGWMGLATTIIATDDGGLHWRKLAEAPGDVRGLAFPSTSTGWAITDQGLYTSSDGGQTWSKAGPTGAAQLESVAFRDAEHGVLRAADGGDRFFTRDSGRTWAPLQGGCTGGERPGFTWTGGDTGLLICASQPGGKRLLRTEDGAQTWTAVAYPCGQNDDHPGILSHAGGHVSLMLCNGQPAVGKQPKELYRSEDDGRHWTLAAESESRQRAALNGDTLPLGGYVAGLFFLDAQRGWVSAGGWLAVTADGGRSWRGGGVPIQVGQGFMGGVRFFTPEQGFVEARDGATSHLLATTDGGASWRQVYPALAPGRSAPVQLLAGRVGMAIGTFTSGGAVLRSSDDGKTWQQVGSLPTDYPQALSFSDPQHGWAAVDDRSHTFSRSLWRTDDGGKTWQRLGSGAADSPYNALAISLIDAQTGYVSGGSLWVTHDGGASFTKLGPGAGRVQFLTAEVGWQGAPEALSATRDGGKTWTPIPLNCPPAGFQLLPGGTAWAVARECGAPQGNNALLLTRDGGQRWTRIDLGDTRTSQVLATDAEHAWLIDELSHMYTTADGGRNWTQVR